MDGPSIFPATSLAARARFAFTENVSLQAGVFDGVPGDLDDPSRTAINLEHGDGALIAAELDYVNEEGTKVAVGLRFLLFAFPSATPQ